VEKVGERKVHPEKETLEEKKAQPQRRKEVSFSRVC